MAITLPTAPTTTAGTTAAPPGEFDWIGQLIAGGLNLGTAQSDVGFGREAAGMADPFSSQRGQYQPILAQYMGANGIDPTAATSRTSGAYSMLQGLLQNPGSLTSMPGYQFGLNQALEGVNRAAGSSGLLNSGNRMMALQDRGQSYAQGWQKQIIDQLMGNVQAAGNVDTLGLNAQNQGYNQLAQLSGVTSGSPGTAAQAFMQGLQGRNNSIGAGLGGVANGAGGLASLFQRILSGGGIGNSGLGGSGLGDLDQSTVYGTGSGWGQDIYPGGSSGFDETFNIGAGDINDWFGGP